MRKLLISAISFAALFSPVFAGETAFKAGPVFNDFGKTASVKTDFVIPKRARLHVLFDTSQPAKPGHVNRTLDSAARFINMHVASGMKPKQIKAAVVIHGKAAFDLTTDKMYGPASKGAENATAPLIAALTNAGVRVILCGQTAAYYGIDNKDLLPGVEMALSAMTAHAVLQNEGYTLNPF